MTENAIGQQKYFAALRAALRQDAEYFDNAGSAVAELQLNGHVFISGYYQGNIDCRAGMVVVAPGADVHGSIHAPELLLAGRLQGDCQVDRLVMKSTGVLQGEIQAHQLTLESGARFSGQSRQAQALYPAYRPPLLPKMAQRSAVSAIPRPRVAMPAPRRAWPLKWVALLLVVALVVALLLFWFNRIDASEPAPARPAQPVLPQASAPRVHPTVARDRTEPVRPGSANLPQHQAGTAISTRKPQPASHPVNRLPKPSVPVRQSINKPILPPRLEASKTVVSRTRKPLVPAAQPSASQAVSRSAVTGAASLSEVQALKALEKLESQALDVAVAQSTQAVGRSQTVARVKRHARQLMQLRKLLRRYAPNTTLLPYRPSAAFADNHAAPGKQAYRQQLQAVVSQLDLDSLHPDTRQLINRLSQPG